MRGTGGEAFLSLRICKFTLEPGRQDEHLNEWNENDNGRRARGNKKKKTCLRESWSGMFSYCCVQVRERERKKKGRSLYYIYSNYRCWKCYTTGRSSTIWTAHQGWRSPRTSSSIISLPGNRCAGARAPLIDGLVSWLWGLFSVRSFRLSFFPSEKISSSYPNQIH